MKRNTQTLIGYSELILAQFCLGIHIVLAKMLATTYSPATLLALRFFIGFMVTAFYLCCTASKAIYTDLQSLSKQDWIVLLLQAFFGGFLFNILTLYGLQYTTATITGIVNSACPAFIAFFSFLFLKEALNKRKIFAILISILGILMLSLKTTGLSFKSTNLLGICLVSLAVIPGALYTILSKLIKKPLSPFTPALIMNAPNMLIFLALALKENPWSLLLNTPGEGWLKLILYGMTGGFLFFILWYRSLRFINANVAGLFTGIMPISTSLLAYLFLSERISSLDVVGMLCVITSLFIGALPDAYWSWFKFFSKKR